MTTWSHGGLDAVALFQRNLDKYQCNQCKKVYVLCIVQQNAVVR